MRFKPSVIFALLVIPALISLALIIPARADDEERKPSEHKITQSKSYLMVDLIYTTIIDGDKPSGGIDGPDVDMYDKIPLRLPVLRDAYVRNLIAFAATSVRTTHQPDVSTIADRCKPLSTARSVERARASCLPKVALRVTN